jgi:DNA-binding transcriptional MerR regulator
MRHSLRLADVANRTGVHAIRWYGSQGLMPGVARAGGGRGGRRLYGEHPVGGLEPMDRLRCTGMSIAPLRDYTALVKPGSAALEERRALLAAYHACVQDDVARRTEALASIAAKVEFTTKGLRKDRGRRSNRTGASVRRCVGAPRRPWRRTAASPQNEAKIPS